MESGLRIRWSRFITAGGVTVQVLMDHTVVRGEEKPLDVERCAGAGNGQGEMDERKVLWGAEEMRGGEKVGLPRSEEADR